MSGTLDMNKSKNNDIPPEEQSVKTASTVDTERSLDSLRASSSSSSWNVGVRDGIRTDSTTRSRPTERKRQQRFRFVERVQVRRTISRRDISEEEKCAAWYTPMEYRYMKAYSLLLAEHYADGKIADGTETESVRGLENFQSLGQKRREVNKIKGWNAVFLEQNRQIDLCILDDERLSKGYFIASKTARDDARDRGCQDAMEVKKMRIVRPTRRQSGTFELDEPLSFNSDGSSSLPVLLPPPSTTTPTPLSPMRSLSPYLVAPARQDQKPEGGRRQRRLPNLMSWKRLSRRNSNRSTTTTSNNNNNNKQTKGETSRARATTPTRLSGTPPRARSGDDTL